MPIYTQNGMLLVDGGSLKGCCCPACATCASSYVAVCSSVVWNCNNIGPCNRDCAGLCAYMSALTTDPLLQDSTNKCLWKCGHDYSNGCMQYSGSQLYNLFFALGKGVSYGYQGWGFGIGTGIWDPGSGGWYDCGGPQFVSRTPTSDCPAGTYDGVNGVTGTVVIL